ncbi:hypothetical protein [Ensifer sp. WSM1721]|uniref:hypothetical protein n=1 Tax=Ensifer sp. WSM1721 TaxID=1041159 RepID=UPI001FD92DAD|nr:hypothetical protein [Ensifer sp. WSM1721]
MTRDLVIFLLATFVAAGMGLSVAQASGMAAKMAMMSEMATLDHGDCQDCPDQPGDGGMKAMACGNVCAAPVVAPLPAVAFIPTGKTPAAVAIRDSPLTGMVLSPDPDPPRTSDIG